MTQPTHWKLVPLGEIITIRKGKKAESVLSKFQPNSKRYLQIEDLRGDNNVKYTADKKGVEVNEEDLIITWDGANAGTVGYGLSGYIGSTLALLRLKDQKIFTPFIGRFLQSKFRFIQEKSQGATIPHVDKSVLESIQIPLPPLDEQKRIAAILERLDTLRQKRKQADALTATFLQSVFLEMFGDPVRNPKGWELKKLGQIAEKFSDGPFGSNLKSSHYTEGGVRVIRLQNIGVGEFVDDDKAFVSQQYFEDNLKKHECIPGDVVVGTMGSPNLRACVVPNNTGRSINKADCVQIRPKAGVSNSAFICGLLNMPETLSLASNMIHGQTRSRISMGQLRELIVPVPPLSLQEQFTAVVEKVEAMRSKQAQSAGEIERLFQSSMQLAFKEGL